MGRGIFIKDIKDGFKGKRPTRLSQPNYFMLRPLDNAKLSMIAYHDTNSIHFKIIEISREYKFRCKITQWCSTPVNRISVQNNRIHQHL